MNFPEILNVFVKEFMKKKNTMVQLMFHNKTATKNYKVKLLIN
jgi:hypothetical protein